MNIFKKIATSKDVINCRFFGARIPISAQLALTNRCPWRCLYCSIDTKRTERTDEVNTEQAISIIQQLARHGNKRLHLVGGEPLLRQDLGKIIQAAKSFGLTVTVATSGYKIPEKWKEIKDIDIFLLSFDGPRHLHDMQRGNNSFETLLESIEFLKERNTKFWTTTVITRHNARHLDFILEMAKKRGFVTNFHLLYFSPSFRKHNYSIHPAQINDSLVLDDRECREVLKYLLQRKRTDMKYFIGSSELYFRSLIEWNNFSQVYKEEKSRHYDCMAGRMYCYIDANADIYPCCDVMGIVEPRNVLKEGFEKAFLSLPQAPCRSCLVACYIELNLMFSLRLDSIFNWANKV